MSRVQTFIDASTGLTTVSGAAMFYPSINVCSQWTTRTMWSSNWSDLKFWTIRRKHIKHGWREEVREEGSCTPEINETSLVRAGEFDEIHSKKHKKIFCAGSWNGSYRVVLPKHSLFEFCISCACTWCHRAPAVCASKPGTLSSKVIRLSLLHLQGVV